MKESKSINF